MGTDAADSNRPANKTARRNRYAVNVLLTSRVSPACHRLLSGGGAETTGSLNHAESR
jgi:hypothetical protein